MSRPMREFLGALLLWTGALLAVPASLMSTPNTKINVGISNSPPATPSIDATSPMPSPSAAPAASCAAAYPGMNSTRVKG